jgi:hypothetical protein
LTFAAVLANEDPENPLALEHLRSVFAAQESESIRLQEMKNAQRALGIFL